MSTARAMAMLAHEVRDVRLLERAPDVLVRRVRGREPRVRADGPREQHRLLRHDADERVQVLVLNLPDRDARDEDLAFDRGVVVLHERRDRGLPRPGRADDRRARPRGDVERQPVEHRAVRNPRVREVHVSQLHAHARLGRVRREDAVVREERLAVHEVEHARGRAEGLDDGRVGAGDERHAEGGVDGVEDKRVELSDGEVVLDREPGAVVEGGAEGDEDARGEAAVEDRASPPVRHLHAEGFVDARREVRGLVVLLAEGSHRANRAEGVLRDGRRLRRRLLRQTCEHAQTAALPDRRGDERRERGEDHEREPPRRVKHKRKRDNHRRHPSERHGQILRRDVLQHRGVRGYARDQRPGRHGVEEPDLLGEDVREQAVPQPRDDFVRSRVEHVHSQRLEQAAEETDEEEADVRIENVPARARAVAFQVLRDAVDHAPGVERDQHDAHGVTEQKEDADG
eukprot:29120-Pelagococcus_subviridis.AAC.17